MTAMRIGMYGKTRAGERVGPVVVNEGADREMFPFWAGLRTFRADGSYTTLATPSPYDIIAEWDCRLQDFDPALKPGEWVQCVTADPCNKDFHTGSQHWVGEFFDPSKPMISTPATFVRCEAPAVAVTKPADGFVRSIRDGSPIPIADFGDDTPESFAAGVLTMKTLAAMKAADNRRAAAFTQSQPTRAIRRNFRRSEIPEVLAKFGNRTLPAKFRHHTLTSIAMPNASNDW